MRPTQRGYIPAPGQLGKTMLSMPHFQDTDQPPGTTPISPYGSRIVYDIVEDEPLIDSSNMTTEDWVRIARLIERHYSSFDGFVILHGTDTMSYTASALSFMLVNLSKTVVLTGSQIPMTPQRNDAIDNLLGAMTIAAHFEVPEVCLYFHHTLFRGNRTRKVDAEGLAAFQSGNYPELADIGTHIEIRWHLVRPIIKAPLKVRPIVERNVACLRIFPGISTETVRNFLRPPLRGLVIESYGSGNAPDNRPDLLAVLKEASDRGVVLVNCTQCHKGTVRAAYASGAALADSGVVSGMDMTVEAALTKLAYLLSQSDISTEIARRLMQTNLRGELSETADEERPSIRERIFADAVARVLSHGKTLGSDPEIEKALFPVLMCAAAGRGDIDALQRLLSAGADPDQSDYAGRSAVHVAAANGQLETLSFLSDTGASLILRNSDNQTPLDIAQEAEQSEIIRFLESLS